MPAEAAVVDAMARRLRVADPARQAPRLFERYERRLDEVDLDFRAVKRQEDAAYHKAAADLLARWPVLDDPWHRDFAGTLQEHRAEIERHLQQSETWHGYRRATKVTSAAGRLLERSKLASAYAERLARAVETRQLAARLNAVGGSSWQAYTALRRCEVGLSEPRTVPTKRGAGR